VATQKSILAALIATEIGRSDKAVVVPPATQSEAEDWFDTGLELILAAHLWTFLVRTATRATVVGQSHYGVPVDFRDHRGITIEFSAQDQPKLKKLDPERFRRLYGGASNGRPVHFTELGLEFLLGPPPDSVATLRLDYYIIHPPVASASASLLPGSLEQVQKLYMLWRGYDSLREGEKALAKLTAAEALLKRLVEQEKGRDRDEVFLEPFRTAAAPPSEFWANPFYHG